MTTANVEPIDGLDTPALVTSGLVGAVGTFALIIALQVLYLQFEANQQQENRAGVPESTAKSLLAEQRSKINRYGWIDRKNDVVAVPIDRAIELTVRQYSSTELSRDTSAPRI